MLTKRLPKYRRCQTKICYDESRLQWKENWTDKKIQTVSENAHVTVWMKN